MVDKTLMLFGFLRDKMQIWQIRLKVIISNGKYVNEYYKTRIGQINNTKSGEIDGSLSKFGKEFHLFLIVVLSFSLCMIFQICIFYH